MALTFAVVERVGELCMMRALGASRLQIVHLVTLEGLLLTTAGSIGGILLAVTAGRGLENVVKHFVSLAPREGLFSMSTGIILQSMALGLLVGVLAGVFPAWRASRLHPIHSMESGVK